MNDLPINDSSDQNRLAFILVGFVDVEGELCNLPDVDWKHNLYNAKETIFALNEMRTAGETDSIMSVLRSALRAFPKNPNLWKFAGTMAEDRGYSAEAVKLFEHGLIQAPDHKQLRHRLADAYWSMGDLKNARKNMREYLEVGSQHRKDAVCLAARIELDIFRNTHDVKCLNLARNLMSNAFDTQKNKFIRPVQMHVAMQIELEAERPLKAIALAELLPEPEKRNDNILTYLEAKAYIRAGFEGKAKQIITPIFQEHRNSIFGGLYFACFDKIDGVEMLRPILGPDFTRMWNTSRLIRSTMQRPPPEERNFFSRAERFWDEGAQAVNSIAFKQMAELPSTMRAGRPQKGTGCGSA